MLSLNPPHIVLNNCISVETAAAACSYSRQYLRRMLREGKLAGRKPGQAWLIELGSLEAYLARAQQSQDLRFGPKYYFCIRTYTFVNATGRTGWTTGSNQRPGQRVRDRCGCQYPSGLPNRGFCQQHPVLLDR